MKLMNIFSFVVFVCICHTLFYSCNKKSDITGPSTKESMDSRITRDLLDFKSNMLAKTSGEMGIDSAIWHIEGLLNLDNANNNHSFINSFSLEDSLFVTSTNEMLTMEQIISIYSDFQINITDYLQNYPGMSADLVDVNICSNELKDGNLKVKMSVVIGEPVPQLKSTKDYLPFGETDDWYWYNGYGKCTGGGTPYDASIMLQNRFNSIVVGHGYFTDIEVKFVYFLDYPDPDNPNYSYMIFPYGVFAPPPNCTCIGHDEMNYYLSKFDYIKANENPNNGKSYCRSLVLIDVYVGRGVGYYDYELYYGIFHEEGGED